MFENAASVTEQMIQDVVEDAVAKERARCAAIARNIFRDNTRYGLSAWEVALMIAEKIEGNDAAG